MRRLGITLIVAMLMPVGSAQGAEVYTVNSTDDRVDADVSDGVCAASDGTCTLRAAISQANEVAGNDLIELRKRTYRLTLPKTASPSNEEGALEVTEAVGIEGRGAGDTIIKQTVNDRVLTSLAGGLPGARLDDLTITGGRVTAPGNQFGGGIFNEGTLSLAGVVVRDNEVIPKPPAANSFGGGILQDDGILLISDSRIKDNLVEVKSETGAAVGGGVMTLAGSLALVDSKVTGNTVHQFGGSAGTSSGGGIDVRGQTQISTTTIAANTAEEGGGIAATVSATQGEISLDSSTISSNVARRGGGLLLRSSGDHQLLNSTISGNRAPRAGSAIYALDGTADLTHVTIAKNPAGEGHAVVEAGALMDPNALRFYGTIVHGRGVECSAPAGVLDVNEQNVFGGPSCSPGISTDFTGNPRLKPLAANGGLTRTHALRPTSPAIDFVSVGPSAPVDQRGVARPFQASDAGSFERE
ncbi:MAG: choice-of-anchor Q domain-containing protein [Solirubrobacterales bacterium]